MNIIYTEKQHYIFYYVVILYTFMKKDKENEFKDELIHIPNKEKLYHEKWFKGRNKLNIPHPYRILLLGGVNRGKTNTLKNIIIRANPKFKRIFLYHCGGDYVEEYSDIDIECIDTIPEPDSELFDPKIKSLLIIEDKSFKFMKGDELYRLDRCFGYVSTHRNLSIITTAQYFFNVPSTIRDMSNVYILWKVKDLDTLKTIGRRVGLKKEQIMFLMNNFLKEPRDSLWIDKTWESPYPLRLNGFKVINKVKQ